jgi:hypothetical protein
VVGKTKPTAYINKGISLMEVGIGLIKGFGEMPDPYKRPTAKYRSLKTAQHRRTRVTRAV